MKVECPSCGFIWCVKASSGKPPKNISVDSINYTLRDTGSVKAAAQKLGCSVPYIYRTLRFVGIDPKEITGRKQKEHERRISK